MCCNDPKYCSISYINFLGSCLFFLPSTSYPSFVETDICKGNADGTGLEFLRPDTLCNPDGSEKVSTPGPGQTSPEQEAELARQATCAQASLVDSFSTGEYVTKYYDEYCKMYRLHNAFQY